METLEEFFRNHNYRIDKLYIDNFWSSLTKKEWISLTGDIIKMIGFADGNNKGHARTSCFRAMKNFLTEGSEYKEVTANEAGLSMRQNRRGNNKRKYYIIHPKAFKKFLLSVNTKYSMKIHQYLIDLEEILLDYIQYQIDYQHQQKQELEVQRMKVSNMETFITNITTPNKDEFVYIATTEAYSIKNQFKIGSTTNLSKRLSSYNVGRPKGDKYYYVWAKKCHNNVALEKSILGCLKLYRDSKNTEIVTLKFSHLREIVEQLHYNHDQSMRKNNEFVESKYRQAFADDTENDIPKPISHKKIQLDK